LPNVADFSHVYSDGKHFVSSMEELAEAYLTIKKALKMQWLGGKVNRLMFEGMIYRQSGDVGYIFS